MIINKVIKICKKSGIVSMVTYNGYQWLGAYRAMYRLLGTAEFKDKNQFFATFDFDEKTKEKIHYFEHDIPPEAVDLDDTVEQETPLERTFYNLPYSEHDAIPYKTTAGEILFLSSEFVAPLSDCIEDVEFYERKTPENKSYIVAKIGYLLIAVIMPVDIITDKFLDELLDFRRRCSVTYNAIKEVSTNDNI